MFSSLRIEDQVVAALRQISRAIDLRSRLLLQRCGLTTPQLAALQAIGRGGPMRVGQIARAIHLSQATVSGIIGRLQNRGLVTRSRNGADRRTVAVELTDAGRKVVGSAPSLLHERFRDELAALPEWERTHILAVLQRIAAMMDAEAIEAVPVLTTGVVTAMPEDVSRYLEKAVTPREEQPAARGLRKDHSSAVHQSGRGGDVGQADGLGARRGGGIPNRPGGPRRPDEQRDPGK